MKKRYLLFSLIIILMSAVLLLSPSGSGRSNRPLACLTLPTAEDSYMKLISDTFTEVMEKNGYRTQVIYCDSSVINQLKQIQNFVTSGAKIIAVNCVGNGEEYTDVFREAQEHQTVIVALNASTVLENCDVQSQEYAIQKGVRQCELVSEFLDREYPDAPAHSVDTLLLEVSSKKNYVRMCAGQKLIQEKFLRYFDDAAGSFIKEDNGQTVFYINGDGRTLPVEEPCGGLILDDSGYAQLNSCYDERILLHTVADKDILTNLDAQNALDTFLISPGGSGLRIVMCFSGDAAKGANERMLYYADMGILTQELEKLAVFGADDTEENREYVLKSAVNESLYRGFMGTAEARWKITAMLEVALEGRTENLILSTTCKGSLNSAADEVEVIYTDESPWPDPDMFFNTAGSSLKHNIR